MTQITKTIVCPVCKMLAVGSDMEIGGIIHTLYKCRKGHITPESTGRPAMNDKPMPAWHLGTNNNAANEGGKK